MIFCPTRNFRDHSKGQKCIKKVGLSDFHENIPSIERPMVNYRDSFLCRNSFCVCVAQKFGLNQNSFSIQIIYIDDFNYEKSK